MSDSGEPNTTNTPQNDEVEIESKVDSNEFPVYDFGPREVFEKFQEFVRSNSSQNSSAELTEREDQLHILVDGPVPDSMFEDNLQLKSMNPKELLQSHKKFQERNCKLEKQVYQLHRSLEVAEDNAEQQKNQISMLEKELRCCQGLLQDKDLLENEVDQLQSDLSNSQDGKVKFELQVKRLKEEKGTLHDTISSQREQNEILNKELRSLTVANKTLFEENTSLKDRCESLEMDVELKDKEIEQKMQLYQEMREQAEEFRTTLQNLQDDKELLLNQLHEAQVETSMFQASFAQSSPVRGTYNLQNEIAEAELSNNMQQSNISVRRSLEQSSSSRLTKSPTKNLDHSDVDADDGPVENADSGPVEGDGHSFVTAREEITRLNEVINQMKVKEEYFVHQLAKKQSKTKELIMLNEKRVTEIALLCDIIHKLGRSKLDAWLDESEQLQALSSGLNCDCDVQGLNGSSSKLVNIDGSSSRLVEALSLETNISKGSATSNSSSCVSLCDESTLSDNVERFYLQATDIVSCSKSSISVRLQLLKKTKNVLEEAITKKLDAVQDLLKDFGYWKDANDHHDNDRPYHFNTNVTYDVRDHLTSALDLIRRYGRCFQPIGALETERRFAGVIEIFVEHMKRMRRFDGDQQAKEDGAHCQALSCQGGDFADWSIDEVTSALFRSVVYPPQSSKFVKLIAETRSTAGLFRTFVALNNKLQQVFPVVGRTTMLLITFFLCTCYSISPVDYKVEAIY